MNVESGDERTITRNDVAKLAGVSTAVVSYVVNNGPRPVADATRQRVLDAIDKLGYRPNAPARWLTTGRADIIAGVVPDLKNPHFAALAQAVEAAVHARGMGMVLLLTDDERGGHLSEAAVKDLSGLMVAGFITTSIPTDSGMRALISLNAPVVMLSVAGSAGPFSGVWPDFDQGTRTLVRHLAIDHGHERIALVTGARNEQADRREVTYRSVLDELGLPAPVVIRESWSMAGGRRAAETLLQRHSDFSAIFASSDQLAAGVLSGLYGMGVSVPDQMALVAYDASPEAAFMIPPLTTAGASAAAMAEEAVSILLDGSEVRRVAHPAELVVRRSCGCTPSE